MCGEVQAGAGGLGGMFVGWSWRRRGMQGGTSRGGGGGEVTVVGAEEGEGGRGGESGWRWGRGGGLEGRMIGGESGSSWWGIHYTDWKRW